jgi:hypothetical protein
MKILSLGAGVQSTTLALMAAKGEFDDMPDAAIFADTGDEPEAVYLHLKWLQEQSLPFPIHVISRGTISSDLLNGDKAARPPLFTRKNDRIGMLPRQCTTNYKVKAINRKIRELCNVGSRGRPPKDLAEVWIGISMDEIFRMRPSRVGYIRNRHPLIEKQMTRRNCLLWLEVNGYPKPPKSSCWHCPYQTNTQWRDKRNNYPAEWQKAVEFDRSLRSDTMIKLNKVPCYVHPSAIPLEEVDLSTAEDRGQLNLFNNECEGMCGV